MIKNRWAPLAVLSLTVGLVVGLSLYLKPAPVVPPTPVPGPVAPIDPPMPVPDGWDSDLARAAAPEVARSLPDPTFRTTGAFRDTAEDAGDSFLWDACRKVTGDLLPPRDQSSVGSCVSFGTVAAIEHLECVQILMGNAEEFRTLAQEVVYGGSRVQVGGGRIRGDGSVGAWAAKFVKDYGVIARGKYDKYDLSAYSVSTCRSFGALGCPRDLEPVARLTPVRAISQVTNKEEAKRAIQNGYPIAICSGQGFAMQRDAEGFCAPRGSWAHCLGCVGYRGGKREGFFLLNSWGGNAHTGPSGAGNPSPAGFWADADVVDRMLRQGDSWAFSDLKGFPARKIKWWVTPGPPRRDKGDK